jgi:hypothetical protein
MKDKPLLIIIQKKRRLLSDLDKHEGQVLLMIVSGEGLRRNVLVVLSHERYNI